MIGTDRIRDFEVTQKVRNNQIIVMAGTVGTPTWSRRLWLLRAQDPTVKSDSSMRSIDDDLS